MVDSPPLFHHSMIDDEYWIWIVVVVLPNHDRLLFRSWFENSIDGRGMGMTLLDYSRYQKFDLGWTLAFDWSTK